MKAPFLIHARHVSIHFDVHAQPGQLLSSCIESVSEPLRARNDPVPVVQATRFDCIGETVVDNTTGLMWSANDVGTDLNHADAEKATAAYRGGDYTDWRLPTRAELLTLVDDTSCSPAIDTAAFKTCKSQYYWTSSPYAGNPDYAWLVGFGDGYTGWGRRGDKCLVRAVRSVSPSQ